MSAPDIREKSSGRESVDKDKEGHDVEAAGDHNQVGYERSNVVAGTGSLSRGLKSRHIAMISIVSITTQILLPNN